MYTNYCSCCFRFTKTPNINSTLLPSHESLWAQALVTVCSCTVWTRLTACAMESPVSLHFWWRFQSSCLNNAMSGPAWECHGSQFILQRMDNYISLEGGFKAQSYCIWHCDWADKLVSTYVKGQLRVQHQTQKLAVAGSFSNWRLRTWPNRLILSDSTVVFIQKLPESAFKSMCF